MIFRRKVGEILIEQDGDWQDRTPEVMHAIDNSSEDKDIQEIVELTYGSISSVPITTKDGESKKMTVVVCGERAKRTTYRQVPPDTDILVSPLSEGDYAAKKDIATVAAYGELELFRSLVNSKFSGHELQIVTTNERTGRVAVIQLDPEGQVIGIISK
jgi:hypothetical protein